MKLSILMPTYNEEKYIENTVLTILNSDLDINEYEYELLIIDGNSEDNTLEILNNLSIKYKNIKILHNPDRTVPYAMNLGIKKSKGQLVILQGAHSEYPSDYYSKMIQYHEKLTADLIGGVLITQVKTKNKKSESIKNVLSDKLGIGNSIFRLGVDEITNVDTVAFGCYKRETFEKYGLYDVRLDRNQDIEYNKRIVNGGGSILLVPDLELTYFARETYSELASNNYSNGKWNVITAYCTKSLKSLSIRHFIPLIFLLSLIIPLLLPSVFTFIYLLSPLSLLLYLIAVIIRSFYLSTKENSFIYLLLTFAVLHFSYAIGSLTGLIKLNYLFRK
ncbi:glycosyltransferase family 2 protein [Moritella sp. 24]|uniref:glycosyltransferase family 2 protein n=1 Tax=Moritella sp. 24 TaxID=2746230 RepID=UPI001BA8F8DC|nr:glycosyltransferase family 2 protein [Moritella sp. 24]